MKARNILHAAFHFVHFQSKSLKYSSYFVISYRLTNNNLLHLSTNYLTLWPRNKLKLCNHIKCAIAYKENRCIIKLWNTEVYTVTSFLQRSRNPFARSLGDCVIGMTTESVTWTIREGGQLATSQQYTVYKNQPNIKCINSYLRLIKCNAIWIS